MIGHPVPKEAMSAVPDESPRTSADLTVQPDERSGAPERDGAAARRQPPAAGPAGTPSTDFGPNEWLLDELYQRYQNDRGSVDRAWCNSFADFHPAAPAPAVQSVPPGSPGPAAAGPAAA